MALAAAAAAADGGEQKELALTADAPKFTAEETELAFIPLAPRSRAEELALIANSLMFAAEELAPILPNMEDARDLRLVFNGEGLGGTEAGGDTTIPSPNISCVGAIVRVSVSVRVCESECE